MEFRFYQFSHHSLPEGVARLSEIVHKRGLSIYIYSQNLQRLEAVDEALWKIPQFLPHSFDLSDALCKIWLSDSEPSSAQDVIFCLDDEKTAAKAQICCYLFSAEDHDIVKKRREDWKIHDQNAEHITYWAETETGWKKQAEKHNL